MILVHTRAGEPKPGPLEKKTRSRYSSLGKILSFMVKNNYFTSFIFFLQFYLTSLRGKEYFTKEPEPGVFGLLEPEPLQKNTRSQSRLGKNQEPEPREKKVRSRSRGH